MAAIFLSYAHENRRFAEKLARVLDSARHQVWWDRQIDGGEEFSAEIENQLARSDLVLVVWSEDSVKSRWVRDEAAVGCDRGVLVPVSIDGSVPPMGFRQFQTIDLTNWKAGNRDPRTAELLQSLERRLKSNGEALAPAVTVQPRRRFPQPSAKRSSSIAAVLVFALVAASYFLLNRGNKPTIPVVTVAAADNSSASRLSANDLLIKLGSLQSTKADALQLVEQGSQTRPDLRFTVAQSTVDGQAQTNVALLAGDTGGLLWSRDFQQVPQGEGDLRQQVAYSAATVLTCASEALAPGHGQLQDAPLKLYLAGCARLSDGFDVNPGPLVETFAKVTREAPDFEGGWAKLLIVETYLWLRSKRDPVIGANLNAHIAQARRLNPTMAEAYVAEAWMQELRQINRWMPLSQAAVEKNPLNPFALTEHANDMFQVGRLQEGVTLARRAVQADPLAPWVRDALITALANAGEIEAAKDALKEAERLWPGASNTTNLRFTLMATFGDAREALELLRSGKVSRQFVSPAMESFLEAKNDPTSANVDRAVREARAISKRWRIEYLNTLAEFKRKEELIRALSDFDPGLNPGPAEVFRPAYAFVRNDARFIQVVKGWGQFDYWIKSGNWPDFCFEPGLPYDCKVEAAKPAANVGMPDAPVARERADA
jgi:adenylate cyclase